MTKNCGLGRKAATQTNKTNGCKPELSLLRRKNTDRHKPETLTKRRQTGQQKLNFLCWVALDETLHSWARNYNGSLKLSKI